MHLIDLVTRNRSYRKFRFEKKVKLEQLTDLVALARLTPSSKNRQPLKYVLVTAEKDCRFVFQQLKWAWFLKDWAGPSLSEQPPAYIVVAVDKNLNEQADIDAGIVSQTMLLGATEMGLGGCIIRTVNRYELKKHFQLPDFYDIILVIALGYPDQAIQIEPVSEKGETAYYETPDGVHVVPKRALEDLIIIPHTK